MSTTSDGTFTGKPKKCNITIPQQVKTMPAMTIRRTARQTLLIKVATRLTNRRIKRTIPAEQRVLKPLMKRLKSIRKPSYCSTRPRPCKAAGVIYCFFCVLRITGVLIELETDRCCQPHYSVLQTGLGFTTVEQPDLPTSTRSVTSKRQDKSSIFVKETNNSFPRDV